MTPLIFRGSTLPRNCRVPLAIAAIHWVISLCIQPLIFEASPLEHFLDYILCRFLLFLALYGFWTLVVQAVREPASLSRRIVGYALPILALQLVWLFHYHPFVLESDELNLFLRATQFDSFAFWFNYPSGYYWIIGLMIVPHYMGPVFLKVLLQALLAGYLVARARPLCGRWAFLLYLLFCIPFVLDQGNSAHRLPTYGLLYLWLIAKLLYDRIEERRLDIRTLVLLSAVISLLAIWRSEGIYLFPMGAILLVCAYRIRCNAAALRQFAIYALVAVLVAVPQLKGYFADSDVMVELRTKPLCGYALSIMYRNGLTEEMLEEVRPEIEGYLSFESLSAYDQAHEDDIYAGAGVMNLTKDADYNAQLQFCDAVKTLILRHPLIYLRAQWNAWNYTSTRYALTFSGGVKGVWNGLTALSYWVWPPTVLVLLFCLYALIRRHWLLFWITACGLANWGLVTLLKPATFAKYYYVDYLMGYFLLLGTLCWLLARRGRRA